MSQGALLTLMTLRVSGTEGPRFQCSQASVNARLAGGEGNRARAPRAAHFHAHELAHRWTNLRHGGSGGSGNRDPGSTHVWEISQSAQPHGNGDGAPHSPARAPVPRVITDGERPRTRCAKGSTTRVGPTRCWCCLAKLSARRSPFQNIRGCTLYHCHILEHEDMGMMRNFRITAVK